MLKMKVLCVAVSMSALVATGCGRNKNGASDTEDIGSHASMAINAEGKLVVASYWRSHKVSANREERVGALTVSIGRVGADGIADFGDPQVVDGDERIEGKSNVGQYTSIAIGSDGFARISYYDRDNGDLKLATQIDDKKWEVETVDSSGNVGLYSSLVLENGQPRIAYYDADNGDLKLAAKTGTSWNKFTIDSSTEWDSGKFCSLAADGNGGLAVAFYDATNGDLGFASGNAQGFGVPEWIDLAGDTGRWPSLAFDLGSPRIAYQDHTNQDLKLARRDGGGAWVLETVDAGEWVGADTALSVDRNGRMTITYFDGLNNDVLGATWDGQAWTLSKVAEAGANGYFNNVVLDANDVAIAGWYSYTATDFFAQTVTPVATN